MVDDARICIQIAVGSRMELASMCIQTVIDGMNQENDILVIHVDGIEGELLLNLPAMSVISPGPRIGIERQRRFHFMSFPRNFTHLYLADADAIHDPGWRKELLARQAKHGGLPVCGYNTEAHARIPGNTIAETSDCFFRGVAPGISYLLTAEHVIKVQKWLAGDRREHWMWDWTVPAVLGSKFVVSRPSFVDHVGRGGMHHPEEEGYDGGDRATDPTPWLVSARKIIVDELTRLESLKKT